MIGYKQTDGHCFSLPSLSLKYHTAAQRVFQLPRQSKLHSLHLPASPFNCYNQWYFDSYDYGERLILCTTLVLEFPVKNKLNLQEYWNSLFISLTFILFIFYQYESNKILPRLCIPSHHLPSLTCIQTWHT